MDADTGILVVDDDPGYRITLRDILSSHGYCVQVAEGGHAALRTLASQSPAVALIDLMLGDMDGIHLIEEIRRTRPHTECIVLTGRASQKSAIDAVNLGAYGYLQKPYKVDQLLLMIQRAIEKRQSAAALERSELKYRSLFAVAQDGIVIVDSETDFVIDMNETITQMYGYTRDELVGSPVVRLSADPEASLRSLHRTFNGEHTDQRLGQAIHVHKNGLQFPVEITARAFTIEDRPLAYINIRDITERKAAEEQLRQSLLEKETLLKEIHHRVKNNLQVVSSLLHLQAVQTDDEDARRSLDESRNRVQSMALVHERLYQSVELSRIDFARYARDLISGIQKSFGVAAAQIRIVLELASVDLNIDQSIPCGLLITELLTNAFKHAFPNEQAGEVGVKLWQQPDNVCVLSVWDNGIGLSQEINMAKPGSLGLQLVSLLADQLDGRVSVESDAGTTWTIRFPYR